MSARDAVRNCWAQKSYNVNTIEVIDLTQEETEAESGPRDEILEVKGEELEGTDEMKHFSFQVVKSEVYDRGVESPHFITMSDILNDKDIVKSVLFSFQYELDFILAQFHRNVKEIVMVAQEGTILPLTRLQYMEQLKKCKMITFRMPPYTSHHTKMIINFYVDKTCRIFIPSNNFTYNETNLPQQVCWSSGKLRQLAFKRSKISFQENLLQYLQSYRIADVNKLIIKDLKNVDFESLEDVEFVFATPNGKTKSGIKLLNEVLVKHDAIFRNDINFLCQTSSIGASLSQARPVNLFTHVMIPSWTGTRDELNHGGQNIKKSSFLTDEAIMKSMQQRNIKAHILYPTLQEITQHPASRGWFHFRYKKGAEYYKMLKDKFAIFSKQDPTRTNPRRGLTPSHSKFYMASVGPSFHKYEWCCYTSANLSVSAWGTLSRTPRNYEAGVVLFTGSCSSFPAVAGRNTPADCVVVPFTLPPLRYAARSDDAFNADLHEGSLG